MHSSWIVLLLSAGWEWCIDVIDIINRNVGDTGAELAVLPVGFGYLSPYIYRSVPVEFGHKL
jgi:hypothetical protein